MAGMDRIYYTLNGFYHTIIVLLYTRYSVVSVQQERGGGGGGERGKNVPSDVTPAGADLEQFRLPRYVIMRIVYVCS